MGYFNLLIQILMSFSLLGGAILFVTTIAYHGVFRRVELFTRYTLAALLFYSVLVRMLLFLQVFGIKIAAHLYSPGFDLFYIMLCTSFLINLIYRVKRKENNGKEYHGKERRKNLNI